MRAEKEYEELYTKAKARMYTFGARTDADVIVGLEREVDYYRGKINRLEEKRWLSGLERQEIMATNKYSEIEIQTAENLLKCGYKWIARNRSGKLLAYHSKPSNRGRIWLSDDDDYGYYFCEFVPIFQNISIEDSEPTSLESIVHPQILDDVERRYLSAVIRPFRDRVQYIAKAFADDACVYRINCYIFIHFKDGSDDMDFPVFHESKMYKGMKSDKAYTLEELGL